MLFGHDITNHISGLNALRKKLSNDHIKIAEPVYADMEKNYHMYKEISGRKYEPDIFPDNKNILLQLGRFIGYLHKKEYRGFGAAGNHTGKNFKSVLSKTYEFLIAEYWNSNEEIKGFFKKITETELNPNSFSLIMPDISANQFVFSDDMEKINGLIDLDAYVIGPRELELAILELCMPSQNSAQYFKQGYEEFGRLPDIRSCRAAYRFLGYLCDPENNEKIRTLTEKNIYFE